FLPVYKPDWSPERFRSHMYVNHLSVLRRSLAIDAGGFRREFEGSQDYDLVLRVTERARRGPHLPIVGYHWRGGGGRAGRQCRRQAVRLRRRTTRRAAALRPHRPRRHGRDVASDRIPPRSPAALRTAVSLGDRAHRWRPWAGVGGEPHVRGRRHPQRRATL